MTDEWHNMNMVTEIFRASCPPQALSNPERGRVRSRITVNVYVCVCETVSFAEKNDEAPHRNFCKRRLAKKKV